MNTLHRRSPQLKLIAICGLRFQTYKTDSMTQTNDLWCVFAQYDVIYEHFLMCFDQSVLFLAIFSSLPSVLAVAFFFVWSNPFTHCKNTFSKHTICTVHKSVHMRFVECQHSLTSSWLDQWSTATKMFITHLAYRSSFRSCSFTEMHKIVLVCCF